MTVTAALYDVCVRINMSKRFYFVMNNNCYELVSIIDKDLTLKYKVHVCDVQNKRALRTLILIY